ncbi:gliding motility-associated C-terminal domain-containing protein [Thermophagus sp. OGC60D27]|uniref:T9SS type B sorting domain-containing protein n=1 Tax=Thermophagus sp. OGC60D27 TaxID=3458415 RepID=UPI004037810E
MKTSIKYPISGLLPFILFLGLFFNTRAQSPNAEFVINQIDVCAVGKITVELKIRFYGDAYFGFKIKDPNGTEFFNSKPIYEEDLVDGVFTEEYSFTFSVPNGTSNRTGTFEILEVFDSSNGGTWKNLSDEIVTFTNWGIPKLNAGTDIDSCGLNATLGAIPDPISNTYYWELPSQGTISDLNEANPTFTAPNTGNYTLVFHQENGACSASDDVSVILRGSPSAKITTNSEVCGTDDQTAVLNLTFEDENGPWDYGITNGESTVITNNTSTATTTETVTVNGETTFSFSWVRDQNGCFALPEDIAATAAVKDLLPSPNAGNDTAICGIRSIVLESSLSPKAQSGHWIAESGVITDSGSANTKIFQADEWGEHIVTWEESNSKCTASDSRIIRFDEPPITKILTGEKDTLYQIYHTTLQAATPLEFPSKGAWHGQWSVTSGSANIASPNDTVTLITQVTDDPVIIEWQVTNGVCPEESDQIAIYLSKISYFTGISPNQDGRNDYFFLRGAEDIEENEFIVFDQNGQIVYRKNNFQRNPEDYKGWNGTALDGKPLNSGIYYFIFKGKGIEPVQDYIIIKRQ